MKLLSVIGLSFLFTAVAVAHSVILRSSPEPDAVLTESPEQIVLEFKELILLTRVQITSDEQESVNLNLGHEKKFSTRVEIPTDELGKGRYTVLWRGLSDDGHAMHDSFMFVVK